MEYFSISRNLYRYKIQKNWGTQCANICSLLCILSSPNFDNGHFLRFFKKYNNKYFILYIYDLMQNLGVLRSKLAILGPETWFWGVWKISIFENFFDQNFWIFFFAFFFFANFVGRPQLLFLTVAEYVRKD